MQMTLVKLHEHCNNSSTKINLIEKAKTCEKMLSTHLNDQTTSDRYESIVSYCLLSISV